EEKRKREREARKAEVKCTNCPAVFPSREQMKAHKSAVHPVKKVSCGNCKKEFTTPFNRDEHEDMCILRSEAQVKRVSDRKERNRKRHEQHERQQQQKPEDNEQDGEPVVKQVRTPPM